MRCNPCFISSSNWDKFCLNQGLVMLQQKVCATSMSRSCAQNLTTWKSSVKPVSLVTCWRNLHQLQPLSFQLGALSMHIHGGQTMVCRHGHRCHYHVRKFELYLACLDFEVSIGQAMLFARRIHEAAKVETRQSAWNMFWKFCTLRSCLDFLNLCFLHDST